MGCLQKNIQTIKQLQTPSAPTPSATLTACCSVAGFSRCLVPHDPRHFDGPVQSLCLHAEVDRRFDRLAIHTQIAAIRWDCSLQPIAAQFVSGYIYSPSSDQGPQRLGGGHTHAWVRVYLPSCGWTEFDPTNGIVGNRDLIRVAVARDPRQAIPLCGTWDGAAGDYLGMDVEVEVRVHTEQNPVRRVA